MHHGTSLTTICEENSKEHEQTSDKAQCSKSVLGLVGNINVCETVRFGGDKIFPTAGHADTIIIWANGIILCGTCITLLDQCTGKRVIETVPTAGVMNGVTTLQIFHGFVNAVKRTVVSLSCEAIRI